MKNKAINVTLGIVGAALLGSLFVAGTASADQGQAQPSSGQHEWQGPSMGAGFRPGGTAPGVFGTVSAINGSTLTVTSKGFGGRATTTAAVATTYSVDASSATVMKNGATSTLSAVAIGDMVMVQGTVSGTSVTATTIRDGMPKMTPGMSPRGGHATSTPMNIPQGNGEPVIGGAITAVSGSSLTVTNKAGVTYTVDASSATVTKGHASSTVSSVAVGDNVIIQGAVNGNAVTASSVIDSGAAASQSGTPGKGMGAMVGGFFGGLGNLLHGLFGFF